MIVCRSRRLAAGLKPVAASCRVCAFPPFRRVGNFTHSRLLIWLRSFLRGSLLTLLFGELTLQLLKLFEHFSRLFLFFLYLPALILKLLLLFALIFLEQLEHADALEKKQNEERNKYAYNVTRRRFHKEEKRAYRGNVKDVFSKHVRVAYVR